MENGMKFKDLTGTKHGELMILNREGSKNGSPLWRCQCSCGKICYYTSKQLRANNVNSCGHLRSPDITGQRFGKLVALKRTNERDENYNVFWDCICDCGKHKLVTVAQLKNGNVRSCGCVYESNLSEAGKKGGAVTSKKQCVENTNLQAINYTLSGKLRKNNTSGKTGVMWISGKGKWEAKITFKKKVYHLGYYDNFDEAVKIREQAENLVFKEFVEWYNNR